MFDIEARDAERIAKKIRESAKKAKSELDLQVDVSSFLKGFFEKVGMGFEAHHNITIIKGRPDTLYGRAIIEYKVPTTLQSSTKLVGAVEEAQRNIQEVANKTKEDPSKYIGIILDGEQITFTKYRQNKWVTEPVSPINAETVRLMLEYLRGLSRKPLHPDFMVEDFGPESSNSIAKQCVQILYDELHKTKNPRTRVLYNEWRKTFNQVCGYDFQSTKLNVNEFVKEYEIKSKSIDLAEILFATHTYYALVIKFLAAEITVTYASKHFRSFLEEVVVLDSEKLKTKFAELEEGGIFAELGIKNFLEGDFFGWYIDIWNKEIRQVVDLIVRKLLQYEPATATLEPDNVRDLLKKLYQYLIPGEIRHALGEFFTPDWLAELTLDEVGFDGDPNKRFLDPGCGSGTFLVLAIKRIKEKMRDNALNRSDTLTKILDNVVGFDLNPLAVIASRANYLIAIGDLLGSRKQDIHIPVYLSDSISTSICNTLVGRIYEVSTSVGKFKVPGSIVEEKLIDEIFSVADDCVKHHYQTKEFKDRLISKFKDIDENVIEQLGKLYDELLKLELKGINRIWTRVIKNAFAPAFVGKFDYVVGNPPWVNWESLPEEYRNSTEDIWKNSGLISKFKGPGLGRVKKDISMLFVVTGNDKYLAENGTLGFLITFTLFKNQAGAGFRKYLATKSSVISIHDLVELRPFEGAVNRTSLLVLKKGRTNFPIKSTSFTGDSVSMEMSLEDVLNKTKRMKMIIKPITNNPESPWMMIEPQMEKIVQKVLGASTYRAYAGIFVGLNGAYWVDVKDKSGGNIVVTNLAEEGKTDLQQITATVEPDLVYPLLRGRDVDKWIVKPSAYWILPIDKEGNSLSDRDLKVKYPKAYSYFSKFKEPLLARQAEPFKSKIASGEVPFFWIFNAAPALSKWKVAWKEISGKISGKGEFIVSVIPPIDDKIVKQKPAVPDHKIMFITCGSEDETFYLAAVLNSTIIHMIVKGYTIETHISTDVVKNIWIPEYNKSNSLHKELAKLAKMTTSAKQKNDLDSLERYESKIDEKVAELYDLTSTDEKKIGQFF